MPATIDAIRRQLADAEAIVSALRARLSKMEAAEIGNPAPVCGLDMLWEAALPKSRERSSKHQCRKAWAAIPSNARPTIHAAIAALKLWNRCDQWYASDHIYAPGLHKFIAARMWESLPEKSKVAPLHRNMSNPQPPTHQPPGQGITDPAEISRLLGIAPKPPVLPKILERMHGPEQIAEILKSIQKESAAEVSHP